MKTIVKAQCQDQDLKLTEEPLIASGGVHENFIEFNFCEKWNGFSKTAVFYRDAKKVTPYYSVIDSSNMCEVPFEVTENEGTMYFGVFGVLDDITRTTKVEAYKIKKGAITTELVPSEPSPDIWEQLMAQHTEILEAVEGVKASQQEFMNKTNADQAHFKEEVLSDQASFKAETDADQEEFKEEVAELIEGIPDLVNVKTTTDTTLKGSFEGSLDVLEIQGNTEQKTMSGKNLLNCSNLSKTEGNGITFTPVYDKNGLLQYINVNGTATAHAYLNLNFNDVPPKGNLIGSIGDTQNGITCAFGYFRADNTYASTPKTNSKAEFSYPEEAVKMRVYLQVDSGTTANNVKLYPMLRKAEITGDTYEPYLGGVELIQGVYGANNGSLVADGKYVCSKETIPCKSGDIVKISTEAGMRSLIYLGNDSGYLSFIGGTVGTVNEFTITENATKFLFAIHNENYTDMTPQTVGKVSVTVNGKPIYVHTGAYTGGMTSPSPYYPQTMYNYGDCVETILGAYQTVGGAYSADKTFVCNKYPIPCKKGDVVNITLEKERVVYFMGYGANGYIGYVRSNSKKSHTYTVSDGVTHLNFDVYNVATLDSADDIGKVTITINGKYVNPIRNRGKNVLYGAPHSTSSQGVSTTPVLNAQGNVAHYDINGTSQGDFACALLKKISIPKGEYILSLESEDVSVFRRCYIVSSGKTISGVLNIDVGSSNGSITFNITKDITDAELYFWGKGGTSFKNTKIKIMLREADVKDDTYEPYKESVAYYLTNEPTRVGDKTFKDTDGLWKVERDKGTVVYDGSSDEMWNAGASFVFTSALGKHYADINEVADIYCTVATKTSRSALEKSNASVLCVSTNGNICFKTPYVADVEAWRSYLVANPITVIYPLATPTIEVLDTDSQIALNSLETFNGVTYIEFDATTQPLGTKVKFGKSEIGAMSIDSDKRLDALETELKDKTWTIQRLEGVDLSKVHGYIKAYCINCTDLPVYDDLEGNVLGEGFYEQWLNDYGINMERYTVLNESGKGVGIYVRVNGVEWVPVAETRKIVGYDVENGATLDYKQFIGMTKDKWFEVPEDGIISLTMRTYADYTSMVGVTLYTAGNDGLFKGIAIGSYLHSFSLNVFKGQKVCIYDYLSTTTEDGSISAYRFTPYKYGN